MDLLIYKMILTKQKKVLASLLFWYKLQKTDTIKELKTDKLTVNYIKSKE